MKSIKLKRVENVLKQIIPEALAMFDDEFINGLVVTDVECTRGKYDAKVYLDPAFITAEEQKYILKTLPKLSNAIKLHCQKSQGWFRAPNFRFIFDTDLDKKNKMADLFAQINQELNNKGKKS
jgi:ribosome-binding factor A